MSDPLDGLRDLIERTKRQQERDAETFASLDGDLCMLCDAYGADKRSLFIDCGYAIHEVLPEVLDIRAVEHERGRGYYLLICKSLPLRHIRLPEQEVVHPRLAQARSEGRAVMPTCGHDSRGFHSAPDYRELLGRLDFSQATGRDVTFSADECWVLREHIHFLARDSAFSAERANQKDVDVR